MNLGYIDMVIERYDASLTEEDKTRLAFFRKLWGVMDSCEKELEKEYSLPKQDYLHTIVRLDESVLKSYPCSISLSNLTKDFNALLECALQEGTFPVEISESIKELEMDELFEEAGIESAGKNPLEFLNSVAGILEQKEVDGSVIGLIVSLVSLALRIQLEPVAEAIVDAIGKDEMTHVHSLNCPVCGSKPLVARVGGESSSDGRGKVLGCLQCGTQWEFERIRCARCGTKHQGHLHYYNIEGDDSHRINTCDECGGYIRTVFVDNAMVPISFEVEDVIMAKLDAIASDPRFHQEEE